MTSNNNEKELEEEELMVWNLLECDYVGMVQLS